MIEKKSPVAGIVECKKNSLEPWRHDCLIGCCHDGISAFLSRAMTMSNPFFYYMCEPPSVSVMRRKFHIQTLISLPSLQIFVLTVELTFSGSSSTPVSWNFVT